MDSQTLAFMKSIYGEPQTRKIRVLLAYKAYPFAIASYFRRALEQRNDIELYTVGEFFGQQIPWNGGMVIPAKYWNSVNLPLAPGTQSPTWESIESRLPWIPDLVLNIDAGFHFSTKPKAPYAVVATDPHVLGAWYSDVRPLTDYFFNMQKYYSHETDIYLPYAFDPTCHYPQVIHKHYDCTLVGLHYSQRIDLVSRLQSLGISVNFRIGDIFDEYRWENCQAKIGLNWSSLMDVNARVFEIMAMRLIPVINRLPDLDSLGFEDGRHYLGFSDINEAVEKVMWAKEHMDSANQIAVNAHQFVNNQNMTYQQRIKTILQTTGLLA